MTAQNPNMYTEHRISYTIFLIKNNLIPVVVIRQKWAFWTRRMAPDPTGKEKKCNRVVENPEIT